MYFWKYIFNDPYLELHLLACFLPVPHYLHGATFCTLSLTLVEFVNTCHNLKDNVSVVFIGTKGWIEGGGTQAHLVN